MNSTVELIKDLKKDAFKDRLTEIYVDENLYEHCKKRYIEAIEEYENIYGPNCVEIYSAPGRSEVGGNHTDHQLGKVLATSLNIDTIAVVSKRKDTIVEIKSEGYKKINIDISNTNKSLEEEGTTAALIRGVAAGFKERGYKIGGFNAYVTSEVLSGSGLSSSAAYETLIGTILSNLFNEGEVDPQTIAKIGQYAENKYFGKPCGLMDQMACSVGGLIYIDFEDEKEPAVKNIDVDFDKFNYSLCIVDTKGSHAKLTDEYATIPIEMKKVSEYFGKQYLREVDYSEFMKNISKIREVTGDRSVLRALHFFEENKRVEEEANALMGEDICGFLQAVKESGESSFKYLQNVYSNKSIDEQNVSLALAISDTILKNNGVCRVHGGGFAGTIQAFVKDAFVEKYKESMEEVFGNGACSVLKIRKYGGIKVI